jgi:ADP-ribose pyrophosphatase YjhB (NUDIX family)
MEEKPIICADVIANYQGKIVLVKRLNYPAGYALPGGKQDFGELLSDSARREFFEETGMSLEIESVLNTFADKDRDPRGRYISTVFVGQASGKPRDEPKKTKVVFVGIEELPDIKDQFIFDHWEILENYSGIVKKMEV